MDELTEAGKRGNGEPRGRPSRRRAVAPSRKTLGSPHPVSRIPAPGSLFGERGSALGPYQPRWKSVVNVALRSEAGSALAVVLVLIVVLTVVGAAMVNNTLTEISIAYNSGDSAAAQYAAEAGLSRAMYELSQNAGWTGTTAAIGDAQYVVTMTSSGSVRLITSTGTRGGGRRGLKAAVAAGPPSPSTTRPAQPHPTIGSGSTGLNGSNNFPSSSTSAVQGKNKPGAPPA